MTTRRQFLGSIALPVTGLTLSCTAPWSEQNAEKRSTLAAPGPSGASADEMARDEDFWFQVQQAFTPDRAMVNLNNGGVCPSPASVQAAVKRYSDHANTASAYVLFRVQDPQKETVRTKLARLFGASPEEIAITRNASEGLENVQQGFDMQPGDEVLTSNQDYPRMLTTWNQRERRNGIVLKQISLPVACEDPDEIVNRFERAIGPNTRVLHCCHVINITGQILPVKQIVAMARARDIPVVVDGAHSFAHLDFKHEDLDCDYYATSLHKFLFAPHGSGMLFVRRNRIRGLWPLMAAPESMDDDIRKFEEIGTHPLANFLAISDAITFHDSLGPARKEARLLYLRDRWARRLAQSNKVKLHTSLKKGCASGVATVQILGVDPVKLSDHLWNQDKIFTVAIMHPEFQGIRISPSVYTTLEEIDRFSAAMERVIAKGLPA